MIFLFITGKTYKQLEATMTEWADKALALAEKITKNNGTDPQTKADVAELKQHVKTLDETNVALQKAIDANDGFDKSLVDQITAEKEARAASDLEHQAVIDKIIEHLQDEAPEAALAVATGETPPTT